MSRPSYIYFWLLLLALPYSCSKSDFLTTKADQSEVVLHSVADCQALLDNASVMNGLGHFGYPNLGQIGCDDYYPTPGQYAGYTLPEQQAVTWAKQIQDTGQVNAWALPYKVVLAANTVLQTLAGIASAPDPLAWNGAAGGAHFFRAFAFFQLVQVFASPYDSSKAGTEWGIPLRLTADVNEKISRARLQASYDQIIGDLTAAAALLPAHPGWLPTRPSKAAVYGLFSRVYLSAGNYTKAGAYADSCLQLQHTLMDYNTLDTTAYIPFTRFNPEVVFSAAYYSSGPTFVGKTLTNSFLYRSYASNDLRKSLFFKNGNTFYGRYDEDGYGFCGIAVDELYLTRAECSARAGNVVAAMHDLNTLLVTRWRAGFFVAYTATDADSALRQILVERRKELLYRGLRWMDLRRLNRDSRFAVTLIRTVQGIASSLPPNDPRYVYPVPDNVLFSNPGMPQNQR
jgi:hypothetical protein